MSVFTGFFRYFYYVFNLHIACLFTVTASVFFLLFQFSLKDELFKMSLLGFALTEAIALFVLMIAFLILFAF